jgi:DNA-binding NtrC family response regulator
MPDPPRPRILLVDDDVEVLDALQRQLQRHFDVTATCDAKEAIRLAVTSGPFAVVVSDLRMPGMDGISLLYLIRQTAPETVRVLLTGHADVEAAISAVNQGNIFRFLAKPCPPAALLRALEACVEQYRLLTGGRELREPAERANW